LKKIDQNPTRAAIGFVVVVIEGDTPELLQQRLSIVVNTAHKHSGTVDSIRASTVIITWGMSAERIHDRDRVELVSELAEQLGTSIKVIHGLRDGIYGNLGSASRMQYGVIIPGLKEILELLVSLNFGETREVHELDA
jgi:hypothetical protein